MNIGAPTWTARLCNGLVISDRQSRVQFAVGGDPRYQARRVVLRLKLFARITRRKNLAVRATCRPLKPVYCSYGRSIIVTIWFRTQFEPNSENEARAATTR